MRLMLAAQADIDNNQASTKDWIGLNPWWTVLPTIITTKRGIIMLAKIAVADYMSKHPVTVKPETDVSAAIKTMLEHKNSSFSRYYCWKDRPPGIQSYPVLG